MMDDPLPLWVRDIVPPGKVAAFENGVLRCEVIEGDGGIDYYRSIDGAHMTERSEIPYAMSALDAAAYRSILEALRPRSPDAVIVDVGGGDGRNALPWLEWGYRRVVVVDPIGSALRRFRARIAEKNPEWLDRLLLIEGDARRLPLIDGCAAFVQAVEVLYYLNEAYEDGLRECVRIVSGDGRVMVSERDYEGGLLTSLLYGSLDEFLAQAQTRDVWDGVAGKRVRSRCFTADELNSVFVRNGLTVMSLRGISAMALLLSYLRSIGKIGSADESRLEEVRGILQDLGDHGSMRRCHVVVGRRA